MTELLVAIAVLGASVGAILSTVQGYWSQEKNYSYKKLFSALITSAFVAYGLINVSTLQPILAEFGLVWLFITQAILGYGIDKGLVALDK